MKNINDMNDRKKTNLQIGLEAKLLSKNTLETRVEFTKTQESHYNVREFQDHEKPLEPNEVDYGIITRAYYAKNLEKTLDFYRVKKLDRDDIEDLGWSLNQSTPDGSKCYKLLDYILYFLPKLKRVCLKKFNEEGNTDVLFYGNLKNKTELRKLMQQIGIEVKPTNSGNY